MSRDWGKEDRERLAQLLFELALAIAESRRLRAEGLPNDSADREVDRVLRFARELVGEGDWQSRDRMEASQ